MIVIKLNFPPLFDHILCSQQQKHKLSMMIFSPRIFQLTPVIRLIASVVALLSSPSLYLITMTTCDVNGSRNCPQNFLKKPKIGHLFVCFKWNEKRNFKIVPSIFTFWAMSSYASRTFDEILQEICKILRSFRLKTKEIANFECVK